MEVRIPNLGDGVSAATVLSVQIAVGDSVKKDQTILELETDKAVAPVPATSDGVVSAVLVSEGDKVSEGKVVATLNGNGASTESVSAAPTLSVQPEPPVVVSSPQPSPAVPSYTAQVTPVTGEQPHSAPSVRKIARQLNIDLRQVQSSHPTGRISMDDLKGYIAYLQTLVGRSTEAQPSSSITEVSLPDFSKWGSIKKESVSSLRQKIGEKMSESWNTVPHVTQFDDANITDLMALRKKYNPKFKKQGLNLTVTVFAMKAVVEALKAFPVFNSSYDAKNGELIYKNYYHIGVAVDTDSGLIVPVIRDVDKKSLKQLAQELSDSAEKARNRSLTLDDLQGGTFTLSNLGGLGVSHFTPIVNTPEVAILALSRAKEVPFIDGKTLNSRLMMPVGLSYDHRVIDGADGARFMRTFIESLETFKEKLIKESL